MLPGAVHLNPVDKLAVPESRTVTLVPLGSVRAPEQVAVAVKLLDAAQVRGVVLDAAAVSERDVECLSVMADWAGEVGHGFIAFPYSHPSSFASHP